MRTDLPGEQQMQSKERKKKATTGKKSVQTSEQKPTQHTHAHATRVMAIIYYACNNEWWMLGERVFVCRLPSKPSNEIIKIHRIIQLI